MKFAWMSILAVFPALALAQSAGTQETRIRHMENAILAPCCYSETVYRHRSEIAIKMKAEIEEWIAQGKSDQEILDTYKTLYGTQVLVEPEGTTWWWLHIVPWITLVLGGAVVAWFLKRHAPPDSNAPALEGQDFDENRGDWDASNLRSRSDKPDEQ